jgi:hypothetical protein
MEAFVFVGRSENQTESRIEQMFVYLRNKNNLTRKK